MAYFVSLIPCHTHNVHVHVHVHYNVYLSLYRPVPILRKRRFSGRLLHASHSVSEGDMAMADEMGEGEEGRDDGFVDCVGGEMVKRRSKKRGL